MQCACSILSSMACLALQHFSKLSHKRQDFLNKLLNMECAFRVSLHFSETFFIIRSIERNMIKNVKYPLFLSDFGKIFSTKFHQNPSSGSQVVPCGRTDGHDEANSHFSQFCEKRLIMDFASMNHYKTSSSQHVWCVSAITFTKCPCRFCIVAS